MTPATMPHADFVHLRVHTAYSLSEGAIKVKELVKLCQQARMPAVGIADTNNLFGALEFSQACAEAGIQPIIGCQLAVRREEGEARRVGQRDTRPPAPEPVVLLCQDEAGYANLLKLVSKAFLSSGDEPPHVTLADFEERNAGLLLLTGGAAGPLGRLLAEGQAERAEALLARLAAAFPGRAYVELMRHGLPVENQIEPGLLDLAYRLGVPLVATNEPFFASAGMYEAHDALLCIAEGAYVSQGERRRLTPDYRFKSAEEMRALFADLPEAIDNTLTIARRTAFMVAKRNPILPPYPTQSGRSEADELRAEAGAGLARRLAVLTAGMDEAERAAAATHYHERLDYELGVIEQMGFPGYFLIVSEFIQWAKKRGIPVGPGRGSGAGSVVAWALTITDLDPLRFGLLFERFLNPERVSMPDFDIDFCQDRRDEVIAHVQEKYGYMNVAQIITFGKLQARAVLRDVGRVLQLPYGQVDRICKLVPNNPAHPVTLGEALEAEPRLAEERDTDEAVAQMLDIGMKLEGLYRHASTHAAGVVIGDRPLDALVPLFRDPRSTMPVTQFNMKWVESAGLVKFDFLGLKTLTVLARALDLIERTRGVRVDPSNLSLDPGTFAMLGRGETSGVFQFESSGMRDVLRNMKPDTIEDLIAVVALYRPGPMDNIPSYIKRKHGQEAIDYLHPMLEPILKETFGIIVYQEQVMQIAQVLAGYTLGGADLLRRAMGKKIRSEMEDQRKIFVDGAVAKGVAQAKASEVFDLVAKFAEYGFNKSHAAAYAVVAYQTAYLKANYPEEFMAATMTLDMHATDKLTLFRQELDRLGIALLPPDVNRSAAAFDVEGPKAIRYALGAIRNVGVAAMETLVAERKANGPFKDVADFARRLDGRTLNKRQVENLIKAGALDGLDRNRASLFEGAETLTRYAAAAAEERTSNQTSLFGGAAAGPAPLRLPQRPDWPPMERLNQELEAIGYYLSAHPLDAFGTALERLKVVRCADLPARLARSTNAHVTMAGTFVSRKERTGKNGNRYAFAQFSDASGAFEVALFAEVLAPARELLDSGRPLLLAVDARIDEGQLKLTAQRVGALDAAVAKSLEQLVIVIDDEAAVAPLQALIARQPRGQREIVIVPRADGREIDITLPGKYALTPELVGAVNTLPGVVAVRQI